MFRVSIAALLAVSAMSAQTFEVASVKRSAPETGNAARSTGAIPRQQDPTRIHYPHVTLKAVLTVAYGVSPDQIAGPQWLDDERYDIDATLPAGVAQDQVPVMLQKLLAERFRMALHTETKPRAGYALVVGPGGPKLSAAKDSDPVGFSGTADKVRFDSATLPALAGVLSSWMGRPVTDETGIAGHFNVTLQASIADIQSGPPMGALKELGLKLESRTAPAKYIIVDKADKVPTGN